jgi:hypothetical protein
LKLSDNVASRSATLLPRRGAKIRGLMKLKRRL